MNKKQSHDLTNLADRVPAERLSTYSRLWQFETWLRTMVYVELRCRHGNAWHQYLKLPSLRALENDKKLSHMPTSDKMQTSYMQLSDLLKTVSSNWRLFKPYLPPKPIWDARLAEVSQIRHRVAHFRLGHEHDLDRVEQLLRDIDKGFWSFCTSYNCDFAVLPPWKDEVLKAFIHLDPFPWTEVEPNKWAKIGIADPNQLLSVSINILRREWLKSKPPTQVAGKYGYLYSVTIVPRNSRRIEQEQFLVSTKFLHPTICHICLDYSPCSVRVTLPAVLGKTTLLEIIEWLIQAAQATLRPGREPKYFRSDANQTASSIDPQVSLVDDLAGKWPEYVLGPSNPMTFLYPDMPCSFFGVD